MDKFLSVIVQLIQLSKTKSKKLRKQLFKYKFILMKLLISGSALLASIAHAGLNNIQSDLSLLVAQNSSMWSDRSITTMLGNMGSLIDTYGCWCYFDDNHGKGKGRALMKL